MPHASALDSTVAELPVVRRDSWVFFPVREKTPLIKRWDSRARSDPDRLARWWLAQRGCDWGLACEPSGVAVVDVDYRNGGSDESVADLPPTLCARTPGGYHLYYAGVVPSVVGWRKGVDIKSRGGYVVVPRTGDGSRSWVDPDAELAAVPDWMQPRAGGGGSRPSLSRAASYAPRSPALSSEYGRGALRAEADRVRGAATGERNETLHRAAFRMGQLCAQGEVSMTDSERELGEAASGAGLSREETERALSNGHAAGEQAPRGSSVRITSAADEGDRSRFFTKKGSMRTSVVADAVTRDEDGVVDVAWGSDGVFWQWQDGVWRPTEKYGVIEARVAHLLGDGYRKSQVATVESYAKGLVRWIDPKPNPRVVNFRNGVLDLATGELAEHDRRDYSTVQLAVDYVGEGDDGAVQEFESFLGTVVEPDVVPLIWEVLAYGLLAGNPFEKAVMLVGPERSGKGTTLGLLEAMLGAENATQFSLQRLAQDRFAAASLLSTTANICGDIDPDHVPHPGFLKTLTGGDRIVAERKGRDAFGFSPWVTLFFGANRVPTTSDVTSAYASRWIVVPFSRSWLGREDPGVKARMCSPEVARAVASRCARDVLPRLLARGSFTTSETVEQAGAEFRAALNSGEEWISTCVEVHDGAVWSGPELYEAYADWARASGHQPMAKNKLITILDSHFERAKQRGKRGWKVRVREEE